MNPFEPDYQGDIRKAASVLILRDRPQGDLEVLMLRRAERPGDFRSGLVVFPGGVLDARDRQAHSHCVGWDDAAASARLNLEEGGLDYFVAAVRESFEEVGLLFAHDASDEALHRARHTHRVPMQRGEQSLAQLCESIGAGVDLRHWAYLSHWLTPPGRNKRFDTRFFVALAPAGQDAVADNAEALEIMWVTPAEALDRQRGLNILPVTAQILQGLLPYGSAQEALDHVRALKDIPLVMQRLARNAKGPVTIHPSHPAYAEVARLDPQGQATAYCDIVPGRVVQLSPRVIRVTAPNPGVMTGPGTNSYLVSDPETRRWTVIDPGPRDDAHLQALRDAASGVIERILVTHTHIDHSPGAQALAEATGAPVWGQPPRHPERQDATFAPAEILQGGERLPLGPSTTLRVLHTPGHASNHLCFLLEEEKTLFCGDHVMQGSTVVINPPDGDMVAYLASLEELIGLDLHWLAPGHGFLVGRPHQVIRALVNHRLAREAKVLGVLRSRGPGSLADLVQGVYDDVSPALHPVAQRSLLAHLLKLRQDGLALEHSGSWQAASAAA